MKRACGSSISSAPSRSNRAKKPALRHRAKTHNPAPGNMMAEQILVIATKNKGKSAEIKGVLKDFPILVKDLNDFGPIPEPVEDGATFEENAYKKAELYGQGTRSAGPGRRFRAGSAGPCRRPRCPFSPLCGAWRNRSGEQRKTAQCHVRRSITAKPGFAACSPWPCLPAQP